MTTGSGLESAWAKYRRGREHAVAFRQGVTSFLRAHPEPTFEKRFEKCDEVGVDRVCWIMVDRGYADPPVSLSTILGDAVHNYRCALDHLSWRLVVAGGVTLTAQQERDVQFPIYADETKYDNNASTRRLPGVGGGVIAAIKKVLRYPVAKPLPPMHTLQALSNDDKHRAIHLVTAALWKADVDFECTGCRPVGYVAPPTMPILKRGTRLAGMNLIYEIPNPTVTLHIKPIPAVFLEDGREATGVLGDIDDEVRALLGDAEIGAAVRL